MNLNQEEILRFLTDVNKLSRRNKPRFIEAIDAKREEFKPSAESYLSAESFEQWHTTIRPKAAAWHWVWCIAAQATMTVLEDITPEIWAEARAMLDSALAEQEAIQSASRAKHNKEST